MRTQDDDSSSRDFKGLRYGFGVVGKGRFRVRDEHIAGHLLELINGRSTGAAKLDLVLRGVALLPEHAGQRAAGTVLPKISWEVLHDLARGEAPQGADAKHLDSSAEVRKLKRNWVNDNLAKLEAIGLVERTYAGREGRRPLLRVLRDDGSGDPYDDPGASGSYTTILGGTIASGALARWDGRTLIAYLAAMYAEHHNPRPLQNRHTGAKRWFRSPAWFADRDGAYGPPGRVKLPIAPTSLTKGLRALEVEQLLSHTRVVFNPTNGQRLQGPRNLYANNFLSLNASNALVAEQIYKEGIQRALKEDDLDT